MISRVVDAGARETARSLARFIVADIISEEKIRPGSTIGSLLIDSPLRYERARQVLNNYMEGTYKLFGEALDSRVIDGLTLEGLGAYVNEQLSLRRVA